MELCQNYFPILSPTLAFVHSDHCYLDIFSRFILVNKHLCCSSVMLFFFLEDFAGFSLKHLICVFPMFYIFLIVEVPVLSFFSVAGVLTLSSEAYLNDVEMLFSSC